jgi:hypothetical protein
MELEWYTANNVLPVGGSVYAMSARGQVFMPVLKIQPDLSGRWLARWCNPFVEKSVAPDVDGVSKARRVTRESLSKTRVVERSADDGLTVTNLGYYCRHPQ